MKYENIMGKTAERFTPKNFLKSI